MKNSVLFRLAVAVLPLAGCAHLLDSRNPYPEVEWVEQLPGAGDRYRTFTPVLKSNPSIALGPEMGTDYGELYFRDVNNDGVKEAIIETNTPLLEQKFSHGRHILRYRRAANGRPTFTLIASTERAEE